MMDIFISETDQIKYVKGVVPNMSLLLLNKEEIAVFNKNGGNCLGVEAKHGPLCQGCHVIKRE